MNSQQGFLKAPQLSVQSLNNYSAEPKLGEYIAGQGFTAKFDPLNEYIGIGCNNGNKLLFSIKQNKFIEKTQCQKQTPITSVKWRPTNLSKIKVLGVGNAQGIFEYWHVPSMKKLFSLQQKDNSIHCIDFSPTGEHFVTAGKDAQVRVYDQNTKSIHVTFGAADWNIRGHSNRIFSVKFIDENTIISGGWDSVVHQWDIRVGKSVKSFYGPHIAGDSIDFSNNQLLIGCYAAKNQIQIWDYGKFQQKQSITWTSVQDKDKVAYVYSCCFNHKDNNSILVGSCGINQVKLYTRDADKFKQSFRIHNSKNGVFSVDHNWTKDQICFTTSHQSFYLYDYKLNK